MRGSTVIKEFVRILASFGPTGLSVIERCPYYRVARKVRPTV